MVIPLSRDWAELIDSPFVRYLRRHFPRDAARLVGYKSTLSGRMCVGVWVSKDAGLVDELQSWVPELGPNPGAVQFIGYMLRKQNKRDVALGMKRRNQAKAARLNTAAAKTLDRAEHRRRRRVGRTQILVPGPGGNV